MGGKKTVSTQEASRNAQQKELDKLDLGLRQQGQSGAYGIQEAGQNITQSLLRGESLPGAFGQSLFGLSEDQISDISRQAVGDIQGQFQRSGILDSGVAAELSARTAADTRRAAAEFNVGSLQNALNLAFGGSAQVQGSTLGLGSSLGQRLSSFGGASGTQTGGNPFFAGLGQGFGSGFGKGLGEGIGQQFKDG